MEIDKRILKDSVFISDLTLSQLRLYRDGDVSWFILITRRENIIEWIDLIQADQLQLTKEIDLVSRKLIRFSKPDKINIGALGNMVPQFHIHIIARYKEDRAWPGAIWSTKSKKSFQDYMVKQWIDRF